MIWRRILRILGWGAVLLVGGTVSYQYAAAHHPPPERSALLARGRALYGSLCRDCHGDRMQGRRLPTTGVEVPPLDKRGFRVFFYAMPSGMEGFVAGLIGTGRGGMPGFGPTLGPEERRSLALLIHAVNTGDAHLP